MPAAIGGSAATLLEACGTVLLSTGDRAAVERTCRARPPKPVTLPIASDNSAIKDGSQAGEGHAEDLQLRRLRRARRDQGVREAVRRQGRHHHLRHRQRGQQKLAHRRLKATSRCRPPRLALQLIAAKILQPLNHSYITNFTNLVPVPGSLLRQGLALHIPYTLYTSGSTTASTSDRRPTRSSWGTVWDPKYKGHVSVLDDYREALSMALLRKGITDVNTNDAALIAQAGQRPQELTATSNVKVSIEGYKEVPEGTSLHRRGLLGRHGQRAVQPAAGHRCRCSGLLATEGRQVPRQQRLHVHPPGLEQARARPRLSSTSSSTSRTRPRTSPRTAISRPSTRSSADELIKRELVPETSRAPCSR